MIKIYRKQQFLLLIPFIILIITGCETEEEEKDKIIGSWTVSKFEEYENIDCTGSLTDTEIFNFINYVETYVITQEGFTWTVTSDVSEGSYTEVGSYTIATTDTTTIYFLMGTNKHGIEGYREGYIGEDGNIMTIKVQKDTETDHIIDKCFNFTFDKIN